MMVSAWFLPLNLNLNLNLSLSLYLNLKNPYYTLLDDQQITTSNVRMVEPSQYFKAVVRM